MICRVIASSLACALAACGTSGSRPPPLLQELPCPLDGGCNGPRTSIRDAAPDRDGAPCVPSFIGNPRSGPAEGVVVELDDPTIPLIFDPRLEYATTIPLRRGTISVEIERVGCGLATGLTDPTGKFSVPGAAAGDVSVRLRPVDRPDLITTIHHLYPSSGIQYPILTRAALDGLFMLTNPDLTPDPTKGQIVVSIIDRTFGNMLPGGTISTPTPGTIAYDGATATGPLGVGAVLNAAVDPYPGNQTTVTGYYAPALPPTAYVAVAQDAVSLIIIGITH